MKHIRSLPDLAAFGWTRMQGAPLPTLLLKTFGVLAVALTALRLLALG